MAFTFKSVGHFLATAFQALANIGKLAPVSESVTSIIPGGTDVVAIEKASFAVLGELASLLSDSSDATVAKLTDAGLDIAVINQVLDLLTTVPQLVRLAKAM